MFQLECFCRSSAFLALRTSQHHGHSALAHLVLPESCLDESGGFIQLSLLMVSQCELGEFVLDLLTGGRAQELRPVRCRWKAGFLERYFTDWGASRAQAGIRRGGERLIICTSETRGDTGDRLVTNLYDARARDLWNKMVPTRIHWGLLGTHLQSVRQVAQHTWLETVFQLVSSHWAPILGLVLC